MKRTYEYAVITIPAKLIWESLALTNTTSWKICFSSDQTKRLEITEQDNPFPKLSNQDGFTVNIPIIETTEHKKLSKQYNIQIDFYCKKVSQNVTF